MKKKNTKRVQKFLESIEWMFHINGWERHLVLAEEQPEDQPLLTAEITPSMEYKQLTLKLYPFFFVCDLREQREALLHELVHVVLQDTKMLAMDLLEGKLQTQDTIKKTNDKATSEVTNLRDYLLTGNLRYAKRAYKNYLKK